MFWWGRGYGQQTSMLLSPRLSHRSPKDLTGPQNLMLSIFFLILGSLQIQGLLARLGGWDVIRWTKAYESIWGEAQGR